MSEPSLCGKNPRPKNGASSPSTVVQGIFRDLRYLALTSLEKYLRKIRPRMEMRQRVLSHSFFGQWSQISRSWLGLRPRVVQLPILVAKHVLAPVFELQLRVLQRTSSRYYHGKRGQEARATLSGQKATVYAAIIGLLKQLKQCLRTERV